jgi:hypothetical protein
VFMLTNTFFTMHRKLKLFYVVNTNIDINICVNISININMPFFLAEAFTMAGAFVVIFGILICCINNDNSSDSYSRQVRRLRKHKCECRKCKK